MIEHAFSLTENLKDKKVFGFLRPFLNLLFTICISSFIFEKCYFEYTWINPADFNSIMTFLFKGFFIIPFIIFCLVIFTTNLLSFILFSLPNFYIARKFKNRVENFSVESVYPRNRVERITDEINKQSLKQINESWYIKTYFILKREFTPQVGRKLSRSLNKFQDNMNKNFTILVRGGILCTIYWIVLPNFSSLLYVATLLLIGCGVVLFFLGYQLAEIVLVIGSKISIEMEKLIEENKK